MTTRDDGEATRRVPEGVRHDTLWLLIPAALLLVFALHERVSVPQKLAVRESQSAER